jgi:hypothetical protein
MLMARDVLFTAATRLHLATSAVEPGRFTRKEVTEASLPANDVRSKLAQA